MAAVVIAGALTLAGCTAPEQPILEQFFSASRLRDTTALQAVSTVIFEPLQQGIVRTFQIREVTPERRDGQTVTKDVTVDAPVVQPDGRTIHQTLVVTMQRKPAEDHAGYGWVITAIVASRPAPRS